MISVSEFLLDFRFWIISEFLLDFRFWIMDLWFQISDFGCQTVDFGFRILYFRFWIVDLWFQIWDFEFHILDLRFLISEVRFYILNFVFQILDSRYLIIRFSIFQHWPCYSKASVLEARMYVCVYLTHFEVCLKPYSS